MREAVVIIDASGAIEAGGVDVLLRHSEYGEQLLEKSIGRYHLVIVGSRKLCQLASDNRIDNLIVLGHGVDKLSQTLIFLRLHRILKTNSLIPRLFVVGDPWKSGFAGLLLKLTRYKDVPIQLQIHADYCALGWKFQGLKYILKFIIAKLIVSRYQILRLVSLSQAKHMKLRNSKRVDIIPVPLPQTRINFSSKKHKKHKEAITFGFFGRLDVDRGTELLIEIFVNIMSRNSSIKLIVGGEGPERVRLQKQLALRFPSQVYLIGYVTEKEAKTFWKKIDVLISLARFESFGRAIRESLLYSRPVIALPSSGVLDLMAEVGPTWVNLIEPKDSPQVIIAKAENLVRLQVRTDLPDANKSPLNSSKLLSAAWIDIIG
jgi:glycosyltransferase involved in cell wall biosynthesis